MKNLPFPVPVVRLIIPNHLDKILLLCRGEGEYEVGNWNLPGGKVDYGETVEEACAKELLEETGLTCSKLKFLFYQNSLPVEAGRMHCINLYFKCQASGNIVLNNESSQYTWIGPADMKSYHIVFRNGEALSRYWGKRIFSDNHPV